MENKKIIDSVASRWQMENIVRNNILDKLEKLLSSPAWRFDPYDHKLKLNYESVQWEQSWVHVRHSHQRNCGLWWQVLYDQVGVFPKWCLNCWKVVVRPRSLKELFALLEVMDDEYDGPCKCGTEDRKYVFGNYGGYFYFNSLEEGREGYARVRKLVDEHISPDVSVILKRYCTEFEQRWGPSHKMQLDAKMLYEQALVEKVVDLKPAVHVQPGFSRVQIIMNWFIRAWDVGDESIYELNGGQPMFLPPVTYHDNELVPVDPTQLKPCKNREDEEYYGNKIKEIQSRS